jgi:hypothetical protein
VSKSLDTADEIVFDLTETLKKAESAQHDVIHKGETHMAENEAPVETVSKSDDDPTLITKADIAGLTKAVEDLTKAFGTHFARLTTPHPQSLGGKKARHVTDTLRKDEDPDPDEDPDEDPGRKVRKDEDPDEDPDPRKMKKSFDRQNDEIEDIRKSFDDVINERDEFIKQLEGRIEKMENEVIRKGGAPVVLRDQLAKDDPMLKTLSNMDLLAGKV